MITNRFRIEHRYDGVIKVFIDGVEMLSVTNTKNLNGYFGLFSDRAVQIEIDRYEYCYI